jgi:CheY-like chemotaxis protein
MALRILVIDDDSDAAETQAIVLRLFGHVVSAAVNGESALLQVEAEWPDVVLLDLGIPDMDGYAIAKRIREREVGRKKPVIIAVTGFGSDSVRLRCLSEGFDHYQLKPVEPFLLRTLLAEIGASLENGETP